MSDFSWIGHSWYSLGPAVWVNPVLAVAAVVCGLLIGGERQRREKPAGLRTLSLVCLGSAVFTMLSFAFTSTTGDSGRVAAQIVTGIGFLGAGVILHGRRIVAGVTTAAIIWVAAAIGMAVGAGYVLAALALSLLVNRLMVLIFIYETQWQHDLHDVCVTIGFDPKRGLTRVRLERVLIDYEMTGVSAEWVETSSAEGRVTLRMRLARIHLNELLAELVDVPDVISVERERCEPVRAKSSS
jgi:putative Mg2+ transporter-C (MgtC) family protein